MVRVLAVMKRELLRVILFTDYLVRGRKHFIIGQVQIGIGNRLIGLANTYCRYGGSGIRLGWGLDEWMPVPFDELFVMSAAPGFKARSFRVGRLSRSLYVPYPSGHAKTYWKFFWPGNRGDVDFLFERTSSAVWDRYAPFFAQLLPSDKVRRRLSEVKLPAGYVAVHVRNSLRKRDNKSVCSVERIMEVMRTYPEDQVFFVSCMESVFMERIRSAFGDRVLELPAKDYHSMIDAVADLWLLGHGRELVCSPESTFTEIAWWWGGDLNRPVRMLPVEYVQPTL